MCTTCGCGHPEQVRIGEVAHSHHDHDGTKSAVKNPGVFTTGRSVETSGRSLVFEKKITVRNTFISDRLNYAVGEFPSWRKDLKN